MGHLIVDDFHFITPSKENFRVQVFELDSTMTSVSLLYSENIGSDNFSTATIVDGFYILVDDNSMGVPTFSKTTVTLSSTTVNSQHQASGFAAEFIRWIVTIPSSTRFLAIPQDNDTNVSRSNVLLLETSPTITVESPIDVGNSSFARRFAEVVEGTTLLISGRSTVEFYDYTNVSTNAIVDSFSPGGSTYGFNGMFGEPFYFIGVQSIL